MAKANIDKPKAKHETTASHHSAMRKHHVGGEAQVAGLKDHGHKIEDKKTRALEEATESAAERKAEETSGEE